MMGYQVAVLFLEVLLARIIDSVLAKKIFITNYTAADRYQQLNGGVKSVFTT